MIIVQITDTHIKPKGQLAYGKVDTAKALYNCIVHVNKLYPKPDLVIFTGDITDSGSIDEYELFKEIIKELQIPFYIIPGNHDKPKTLRKVFKENDCFGDNSYLNLVIENYPIKIIGLDSTIEGKSYGGLCDERLTWLEKQLDKFYNEKVLIFMHHPPVKVGIEHMDVQNLCFGVEKLASLIAKHDNILGIGCGHVHRTTSTLWNNTIVSTAASPSHQVTLDLENAKPSFTMEPPAVQLYYWNEKTGLITHTSYIGEFDGPYPFYDEKGELLP